MPKQRIHREWFRPVERGGRKSCPSCKAKLELGEWIWSWGEYHNAKWHNVQDVCKSCWPKVAERLRTHQTDCPDNCVIELVCREAPKPTWMTLEIESRRANVGT